MLEFFRVGSGKAEKEFCHAEVKRVELHDMVDMEKLRFCIQKYIYADTTIDVNDADEIRKRAERIFNSSTYKKQVERSKKNWLDLSVDEVLKKDLEFLSRI